MLLYKLAKQLKDAGFPYYIVYEGNAPCLKEGEWNGATFCAKTGDKKTWICRYKVPTLSELIEACLKYYKVDNHEEFIIMFVDGEWSVAFQHHSVTNEEFGETLDIALAKFWLAVNIK